MRGRVPGRRQCLGPMLRIASVVLAAALIASLDGCAPAPDPHRHAVKVSFAFTYQGHTYKASYLTTMAQQTGSGGGGSWGAWQRWSPARKRWAVALPDQSLLILGPDWNSPGDGLPRAAVASPAQWAWLNNSMAPTQIVAGGVLALRPAGETRPIDVPWFEPTATVEPADDRFLADAAAADQVSDGAGIIEFSNTFIGGTTFDGPLFGGVKLAPVEASDLPSRAIVSDWVPAHGCQVAAVVGAPASLLLRPAARELILDGLVWRADAGPAPHEPMVMNATGQDVASTDGFDAGRYDNFVLRIVHAISFAGRTCSGITAAPLARQELLRFPDGQEALVAPSGEIAVLKR